MAGRPSRSIRRRRMAVLAAALSLIVVVAGVLAGGSSSRPASTGVAGPTDVGASSGTPATNSTSSQPTDTDPSGAVTPGNPVPGGGVVLPAGFSLKAGATTAQAAAGAPVVKGKTLTKDSVSQILGRLPAWTDQSGLGTDFRWPTQSLTKPSAGQTITQKFPAAGDGQQPPATPLPTPSGPLQILRMQPQGSVSVAPFASITFNQPMIPVSTVGQLADNQVPAKISPSVPGHWDWVGTTTLRFTADSTTVDRLPMATRFTLTVPAGVKSQTGGTLAKAAAVTFTTPAPSVQSFTPANKEVVSRSPVMLAVFNQRIDPAAVLATIAVRAGGKSWPVRAATGAELAADHEASSAASAAPAGRFVAFVPVHELPAATAIDVTVKAGTRSAEGPLTSPRDSTQTFSTYAPLRLTRGTCADSGCQPGGPLVLQFNNFLDMRSFIPATVSVYPAIPGGASITASGPNILISGATQASTTYRITVKAGLQDVYGQKLTQPVGAVESIERAGIQLSAFSNEVTTIDPTGSGPTVTVTSVNQKRFREEVFAVEQGDWERFDAWYQNFERGDTNRGPGVNVPVPDWPKLVDRTVDIPSNPDRLTATRLDLSGQLTSGRKQVVVIVEALDPAAAEQVFSNQTTASWVQSTDLGVDVINDQSSLRVWVTDLRTGAPVSGATAALLDGSGQPVTSLTTDGTGIAAVDLTSIDAVSVRVTKDGQTAILPGNMYGDTWKSQPEPDQMIWYVTDDRQTYRPGETVSVKGWVRHQANDTTLALTIPKGGQVTWTANDGTGIHIGGGQATVDSAGGFDFTLAIPAGAHLGTAQIGMHLAAADVGTVQSDASTHTFTIADFRTPAFQVDTHAATSDPAIRGSDLSVQTDATYYAGGPLGNAPVAWQVQTATASYAPPGWGNYTFGVWTPWWYETAGNAGGYAHGGYGPLPAGPAYGSGYGYGGGQNAHVQTFSGTTDGAGAASVAVNVGELGQDTDGLPVSVVAQATVTDVNRQQIADTATVIVHPADYYVGLAGDATFVKQGEKLTLQTIVTGIDGTAQAGRPVTVTAARVVGGDAYGSADDASATLADPQTCSVTSATTAGHLYFHPGPGW